MTWRGKAESNEGLLRSQAGEALGPMRRPSRRASVLGIALIGRGGVVRVDGALTSPMSRAGQPVFCAWCGITPAVGQR